MTKSLHLDSGKELNHYKIRSPLGKGGMGEVFLAEDSRLDRKIALKILPPDVASDPSRLSRFESEAKAIAALNHPNIVTIFSVEQAEGIHFLTMELVQGQTLTQAIPEGGFHLPQLLTIAIGIAEALAAAHNKGIIHRDLKPGNIMLNDELRVKVLDFGLAKFNRNESVSDSSQIETRMQTGEGVVVGTVPYMSPEQLRGAELDHRTDIFSFGIILYEMATGKRPFCEASTAELISAILKDVPPPINEIRIELPRDLGRLVDRCLEKDPERRIQTAKDVRNELDSMRRDLETGTHRWSSSTALRAETREKSIAVLPFVNHSNNPDDEHFSDGITEEILIALAQVDKLRVAARTSSFFFKGKNEELKVIGEKLNVTSVLEGSIRRAGSRLRITAQLIDVSSGFHLWSERYDREMTDVFEIQDEIAAAIVSKLKISLSENSEKQLVKRGTENLEAYELYLKGRVFQHRRGRSVAQALEYFGKAAQLDPNYADVFAMMSDSFRSLVSYGVRPAPEMMPRAKGAAQRALSLDPDNAQAYLTLAHVALTFDRDFNRAYECWMRALELDPDHAQARADYALWWLSMLHGKWDEAVLEMKKAVTIDPLSSWVAGMNSMVLTGSGEHAAGIAEAQRAVELDPESFIARWAMVEVYARSKDYAKVVAAAEPALQMSGRNPMVLATYGIAQSHIGNQHATEAVYAELSARQNTEYIQPFWMASVAAASGRVDQAMKIAKQAVEERNPQVICARHIPEWELLRNHADFPMLLKEIGLDHEIPLHPQLSQ
jgi:serine/threonine protein kinase/cytochrome c-type biogenesis protein CcmH/NrfG